MSFTVLGGTGFIGQHLVRALERRGDEVHVFGRGTGCNNLLETLKRQRHHHIFYCIGVTADFRQHPLETVEAHICVLKDVLRHIEYQTLTYLSSTRVYMNAASAHEDSRLAVLPTDGDSLYNLSKLMGECLCLQSGRNTRVVRLSNVYGAQTDSSNFLTSVLRDATEDGQIRFQTSPASAKDYVSIEDVARWLPQIAENGRHRIYNLASGKNTSNAEIAQTLEDNGIKTAFTDDATTWTFPNISVDALSQEFGPAQRTLLADLPDLLTFHREQTR